MAQRIKVFVASGWRGEEKKTADLLHTVLKHWEGELEIRGAEQPAAGSIVEKINRGIEWADVVFCVLPRRFCFEHEGKEMTLTSPYVVSEGAFALGRFYKTDGHKSVHLVLEKGIDLTENLGILRELDVEHVIIDPNDIETTNHNLTHYVGDLLAKMRNDSTFPTSRQLSIQKDYYIYTNGDTVCRNITRIMVLDAVRFNGTRHTLHSTIPFEPLTDLQSRSFAYDGKRQSFQARLLDANDKATTIEAVEIDRNGNNLTLRLLFPTNSVDNLQELRYEHMWSMPGLYAHCCEEHYAYAGTPYGKLDYLNFALHFSKRYKFLAEKLPVSTQASDVTREPDWCEAQELSYRDDVVHDTYYTYRKGGFYGTIKIVWNSTVTR